MAKDTDFKYAQGPDMTPEINGQGHANRPLLPW